MRIRDEKIELLRSLPPFTGASARELRALASAAEVCDIEAGRYLCRSGRRALEAYVVVRGLVDVVIDGATVATLRRGQLVGEMGIIDGQPRSADVVAATDVTVLAIAAPALRALIEDSHAVRRALLSQLADRVRSLDLELADAAGRPTAAA
jgi:putative ABC transport system ATP-binding protein